MPNKNASRYHQDCISNFIPGDIVVSVESSIFSNFYGIVDRIEPKENKVYVLWGGGALKQHDPGELANHTMLNHPERRYRGASVKANEDIHGLITPVSGGTNVMWNLVKKLSQEFIEKSGFSLTSSEIKDLKSRRLK